MIRGEDEISRRIVEDAITEDHVAGIVLGKHVVDGIPTPHVGPASPKGHHGDVSGLFHHGVVHGKAWKARERLEQRRHALAGGKTDFGDVFFQGVQKLPDPEAKHAAVPIEIPRGDILLGLFTEGFLHETPHRKGTTGESTGTFRRLHIPVSRLPIKRWYAESTRSPRIAAEAASSTAAEKAAPSTTIWSLGATKSRSSSEARFVSRRDTAPRAMAGQVFRGIGSPTTCSGAREHTSLP
jgi:hypothetical protein